MDYITSCTQFSDCKKYRFALERIWNETLPKIMYIGINPSTANTNEDDNTIVKMVYIAQNNGYGGIFVLNPL
jgi:hypothetical protein